MHMSYETLVDVQTDLLARLWPAVAAACSATLIPSPCLSGGLHACSECSQTSLHDIKMTLLLAFKSTIASQSRHISSLGDASSMLR